jgi:membrane protease YdiL (CAAX protease family)
MNLFIFSQEILLKAPFGFSIPSLVLLDSLETGKISFLKNFFYSSFLGPIAEEVFFRGFFQEKIRDVQLLLFRGEEDSSVHKTIRVVLQAFIFGVLHYHPAQGLFNFMIIPLIFLAAHSWGESKESNFFLSEGLIFHIQNNTTFSLRVLIASRYWPLLPYECGVRLVKA